MGTTSQQPLRPTIINNIAGLCLSLSGKVGIILEQHFVKLLQSHENLRNRLQSSYVSNKCPFSMFVLLCYFQYT